MSLVIVQCWLRFQLNTSPTLSGYDTCYATVVGYYTSVIRKKMNLNKVEGSPLKPIPQVVK